MAPHMPDGGRKGVPRGGRSEEAHWGKGGVCVSVFGSTHVKEEPQISYAATEIAMGRPVHVRKQARY